MMADDTRTDFNDGSAWAALLAAGVGCFAFGAFTDLSEMSATAAGLMKWYPPAGALSGVAASAVIVWIASWIVFEKTWKDRPVRRTKFVVTATIAMVVAAVVMTFPPVYELIGG